MARIRSFNVGNGDMFYIRHNSDNFSIIDCCMKEENMDDIINEINNERSCKTLTRFISTHPDDDRIRGLKDLDDEIDILNFYCVENEAIKSNPTEDFDRYCELRDSNESFHVEKGCKRCWLNDETPERGRSGINFHWPIIDNEHYEAELEKVKNGDSPNNISPIFTYGVKDSFTVMWMGDLKKDFLNKIEEDLDLYEADIVFAPHHGRKTGKIPSTVFSKTLIQA